MVLLVVHTAGKKNVPVIHIILYQCHVNLYLITRELKKIPSVLTNFFARKAIMQQL